jgi:copper oxidase (laccase) domain-containing protein
VQENVANNSPDNVANTPQAPAEAVREVAEEIVQEAVAEQTENPQNISAQIAESAQAEQYGIEQEVSIADEIATTAREEYAERIDISNEAQDVQAAETTQAVAQEAAIDAEETVVNAPEQQSIESGVTPAHV